MFLCVVLPGEIVYYAVQSGPSSGILVRLKSNLVHSYFSNFHFSAILRN